MKIEQATSSAITELWARVEPRVQKSKFLEEAAQELASALRTEFQESAVLARVYFTVPFDRLPPTNKAFAQKLAESAGAVSELKATTPVLSLIGTSGQETDWNDRRNSKGHMGIPLISSAFVDAIPMIAVRMPATLASSTLSSGSPISTGQSGRRIWPAQSSGRQ